MTATPGITFHLPDREQPLSPQDPRWQLPLPTRATPGVSGRDPDPLSLSYGDYFSAIETFIARNDFRQLCRAVEKMAPHLTASEPWKIKIISEKHGAFYHPARIEVATDQNFLNFVVNVALSSAGKQALPREVENLLRLELEFELPFLPRVFDSGEVVVDDSRNLSMFLGEWFSDHHEFHLARDPQSGKDGIHLWDPRCPERFLDSTEIGQLFRKAAYILTCYYNPSTSEQIFPWHHGAGDFLWGQEVPESEGSVRLITVRGYQPLLDKMSQTPKLEEIVDGLVLFFLNMALRLRLDRRDGVGRIGWFGGHVLPSALKGFLEGLKYQAVRYEFPPEFPQMFHMYLNRMEFHDFQSIYSELIESLYAGDGEEPAEVLKGLNRHISDLQDALVMDIPSGLNTT